MISTHKQNLLNVEVQSIFKHKSNFCISYNKNKISGLDNINDFKHS